MENGDEISTFIDLSYRKWLAVTRSESCASVKAINENTRKQKIWLFNVVTHSIFWTLIRTMVNVFHHMPWSPIFFVCRKRDAIMNHRGMFSFPGLINDIRTVVQR